MRRSLRAVIGPEVEKLINIGMAKDGSGVGGRCQSMNYLSLADYRIIQPPFVPSLRPRASLVSEILARIHFAIVLTSLL
jgi:hypothetical protein